MPDIPDEIFSTALAAFARVVDRPGLGIVPGTGRSAGSLPPSDDTEYTAEQITEAIALAIKKRDFPAVVALLKMLAVRDPAQAQLIYDSILAVTGHA